MIHFRGHETRKRSIVKAVSWRTLGSIDTFVLGWLFTGSAKAAGAIASTEIITKMVLYYLHERGWSLVNWGFLPIPPEPGNEDEQTK
ncbi:MAG: DUF2061 domain-containing protein [Sphingomonadales bacterium]|nr:DUF2061 domain-containing protein [Sphingomonadales bacterium]MDE2567923.1 DUF2061 domain-containing protein [Sphingomonadales bacterium]